MNLQQLRYLVATADDGSMTRAAATCHVAQPVLSRSMRALEQELGLALLVRRGRGVELTGDGRRIVDAARRALEAVALIEDIGETRRREHGTIATVATTPTLEAELGAGLAPSFWRRHPELALRFVHCKSREEVAAAVLDGRADVGLCDLPVPDALTAVPIEVREVVLIAPPGSAFPDRVPIGVLGEVPLILPAPGGERRASFDEMFSTLGITPTIALESDERAAWIPAVLTGLGCCVWYGTHGEQASVLGAVVRSFDPPLQRDIAVVHPGLPLGHAAAAFVAVAVAQAREHPVRDSNP